MLEKGAGEGITMSMGEDGFASAGSGMGDGVPEGLAGCCCASAGEGRAATRTKINNDNEDRVE